MIDTSLVDYRATLEKAKAAGLKTSEEYDDGLLIGSVGADKLEALYRINGLTVEISRDISAASN